MAESSMRNRHKRTLTGTNQSTKPRISCKNFEAKRSIINCNNLICDSTWTSSTKVDSSVFAKIRNEIKNEELSDDSVIMELNEMIEIPEKQEGNLLKKRVEREGVLRPHESMERVDSKYHLKYSRVRLKSLKCKLSKKVMSGIRLK